MADIFGGNSATYLDDTERGIAADLALAFDNAANIQRRNLSRYNLAAGSGADNSLALGRTRAVSDAINRKRRGATPAPGNQVSRAQRNAQGAQQLLALFLGRQEHGNLEQDGLIKYGMNAYNSYTTTNANKEWLKENSYETEEGTIVVVGRDGALREVNPQTRELIRNYGTDWSRDADGNITYGEASQEWAPDGPLTGGSDGHGGATGDPFEGPAPDAAPAADTTNTDTYDSYDFFDTDPGTE